MADEQSVEETVAEQVINQLVQHKSDYIRNLFADVNLPKYGNTKRIRERLTIAVNEEKINLPTLQNLLYELDLWGKQRLQMRKIEPQLLKDFETIKLIRNKIAATNLGDVFDGEVALAPSPELTPMRVCCSGGDGNLTITFLAAKTREVWLPQPEIPNIIQEEHPEVVFRPFKLVHQKSISFAEVHIPSGNILISTTALMQGRGYKKEFGEFIALFENFFPFADSEPVQLFRATERINEMPPENLSFYSQKRRTTSGTQITYIANSLKNDFRNDDELTDTLASMAGASNAFCNCVWQQSENLGEKVHTHIYAPEGQIAIMGGAREASARYVLQRIRELN